MVVSRVYAWCDSVWRLVGVSKKPKGAIVVSFNQLLVGGLSWLIVCMALGAVIYANSGQCVSCVGIGAFANAEINWADQTYKVMDENCRGDDGELSPLYYNDYGQLYCIISLREHGRTIPTYTTYIVPVTNIGGDE